MATILVVDDDPDIVESLQIVLESQGHEVLVATTGAEGLATAQERRPDLIILDVMLEKLDTGLQVGRELRGSPGTAKIPIVMITALKELTDFYFGPEGEPPDEGPEPLKAYTRQDLPHVDCFYEKPVKPESLLEKIDELLKKR